MIRGKDDERAFRAAGHPEACLLCAMGAMHHHMGAMHHHMGAMHHHMGAMHHHKKARIEHL